MTSRATKKVIVGAITLIALLGAAAAAKKQFFSPPKTTYITAPVARMDLEESVLASGILKAFKTVAVGAQVNGQLKTLHVALGDKVRKGQLLAEIDPVLPQYALKDAEAQVEGLQAQKRSKQSLLRQFELACQRQRQMNAQDASSNADLESAQAQLESTRHDITALEAQIQKALVAVDTARANLGYTRINAPIDGTVISIDTEQGQTVVSNQAATTILTLATLDSMTVKAKISEADVMKVTPGLPTYFTLLGDSDTRYYGKLRTVEPGPVSTGSTSTSGANASSTNSAIYYYGLFEVPNPENKLKVSMTTQVAIVLNEAKQALCIPLSALGNKKGVKATVQVLSGETAETRTIATGISNNVSVQVIEGLSEGEKVIVGDSSTVPKTDSGAMPPPPGGKR